MEPQLPVWPIGAAATKVPSATEPRTAKVYSTWLRAPEVQVRVTSAPCLAARAAATFDVETEPEPGVMPASSSHCD